MEDTSLIKQQTADLNSTCNHQAENVSVLGQLNKIPEDSHAWQELRPEIQTYHVHEQWLETREKQKNTE